MTDLEKAAIEVQNDVVKKLHDDTRTFLSMTQYNCNHPDNALDIAPVEARIAACKRLLADAFGGVEWSKSHVADLRLVLVNPGKCQAVIDTVVAVE